MRLALAVVLLLAAGLGAYARHAIVDEDAFADRAQTALERPDVRDEVAARLIRQEPLLAAHVVADPRFEAAFRDGTTRMHGALFESRSEEVSLRLQGVELMTLGGGGTLERELRGAAPAAADLAAWWPVALVFALVLLVRAGVGRVGVAVAVAGGVAAAGTVVIELVLLRTFTSQHGDAVVDAIWDSYLAELRYLGLGVALAGLAVSLAWRRART
jgi:hypothetical protein